MISIITYEDFLKQHKSVALLDVRTPLEFEKAHIPDAHNLPLFSNEERVVVGTTYKQKSREEAILAGFDLVGPKWRRFIEEALKIAPDKKVCVHCWRGGMRSGVMAWALDLYGFEVYQIKGGYKAYRKWVQHQFTKTYSLLVLGGMTGSRKTLFLQEFEKQEEQVIDLENLAGHQGSSYGSMNKLVQPSQEQFENNLAASLNKMNPEKKIWIEDESRTIGKIVVPTSLWQQMRAAHLIELQTGIESRVKFLAQEYGVLDKEFLVQATSRIAKRLGPVRTKEAILAIRENRMEDFIQLVLLYYDKTYKNGMSKRESRSIFPIEMQGEDVQTEAGEVIVFAREKEKHKQN